LRIGVGHPGDKAEVVSWVLKKPMLEHRKAIEDSIHRSVKALPLLLAGEMEKAMVQIHTSKPPRPKPPRPVKAPAAEAGAPE
jgi:PTH1 family peptidyl-tRNA hydrolase